MAPQGPRLPEDLEPEEALRALVHILADQYLAEYDEARRRARQDREQPAAAPARR